MKILTLSTLCIALAGCASADGLYYETVKSVSKDNTIAQTACWAAISDIAKNGDSASKVGAIALAKECKNEAPKVQPPKKGLF